MVWEGMFLHSAWKKAEEKGDLKRAADFKRRYEEWSQEHQSEDLFLDAFEEDIEKRVKRLEEKVGI